ncbi:hypothetical protein [Flammeovirga agarivorans]|uniref:Uncharacterized protein n=1 Tax=Flammeovirga agarivorans TaxID=2726742 RepID=A0A7X8SG40_9BACT|nr:hypothetical protein [Flammeovirga agarivorans]NLR89578.1 hypothetical protein [Flammeovirga agarivorans]
MLNTFGKLSLESNEQSVHQVIDHYLFQLVKNTFRFCSLLLLNFTIGSIICNSQIFGDSTILVGSLFGVGLLLITITQIGFSTYRYISFILLNKGNVFVFFNSKKLISFYLRVLSEKYLLEEVIGGMLSGITKADDIIHHYRDLNKLRTSVIEVIVQKIMIYGVSILLYIFIFNQFLIDRLVILAPELINTWKIYLVPYLLALDFIFNVNLTGLLI